MRITPTLHALRLRAFAAQVVPHLAPRGEATVAITGSVARGDAAEGSDLDLWVLGPHSDRQHLVVSGVPVTCSASARARRLPSTRSASTRSPTPWCSAHGLRRELTVDPHPALKQGAGLARADEAGETADRLFAALT